ncbi:MAG: ribosome-associated translation inhibitor RaiA [Gammaproteobacteria bacterium]|nr:ribosome-associated translation inhibitor RaiA [Gammaproteobacteria bacterium]MDH5799454.1 ribosome-associated translation inhibitor RaiA [Gammaproteobacteria bacterium]
MKLPLQITYRNIEATESLDQHIRAKAEKLNKHFPHITQCQVIFECSHNHQHKGNLYHTTIDITVPGKEIAASRESHDKHQHENAYVTISDAFEAVRRQLEEHSQRMKKQVKHHENHPPTIDQQDIEPLGD